MGDLLRKVKEAKFNSSLARQALGYVFREGKYYRLPFGPLRGYKLLYDKTVNFHVILGLWEMDAFAVLSKVLSKDGGFYKPKMTIADVGANLGYYSLWFNEWLKGTEARIHAFEPSPHILPFLRKNMLANQISAVTVVERAVADKAGELSFFIGEHHHSSSLVSEWAREGKSVGEEVRVKSIVLDDYFYNGPGGGKGPDFLKMDIEGGAVYALPGCKRIFTEARPLVYIESHMPEEDATICKTILAHDYQAYRLQTGEWVSERGAGYPNKQGVWGHMLLVPTEKMAQIKKLLG